VDSFASFFADRIPKFRLCDQQFCYRIFTFIFSPPIPLDFRKFRKTEIARMEMRNCQKYGDGKPGNGKCGNKTGKVETPRKGKLMSL